MVDFSSETPQARREWNEIVKVLKEKKKENQPRVLHQVTLSFKNEREIHSQKNKN